MYGLPYALIAPLGGRLGDRVGPFQVALAGTGFLAVVTVLTGLPQNLWVLLPIGVVEAVVSSVAYPNALSAMSRACTPREQATGQGIAGGVALAGAGVMALTAGPLFDRYGPATTFAATGALVAGGGLVIWLRQRSGEIGSGSIEGEREGGDPAAVGL
jgi:predicted MFS family arabinose efflux permease